MEVPLVAFGRFKNTRTPNAGFAGNEISSSVSRKLGASPSFVVACLIILCRAGRGRIVAVDGSDVVIGCLGFPSATKSSSCSAEAELAWMDHKRLVLADRDRLRQVGRRVAQVDRRRAVVVEHAEGVAEPQVDARRLDEVGVPGLDRDRTVRHEAADRAVGEHR